MATEMMMSNDVPKQQLEPIRLSGDQELFLAVCIPYINMKAKMTSAKYLWLNHFPQSSPPPRGPSGSWVQSTFLNCYHLMEHLDLASLPAKSKEAVGKNETLERAWGVKTGSGATSAELLDR